MPHTMTAEKTIPRPTGLVTVDGRTFPLESASLKARAGGGIAATTLSQSFRNPYAEPLEVHYTFPLPADGSVIAYTVHLAERIIRGEVRPREEAREEYESALLDGRAAGLLEQERAETFTQSLGSLPPGEPVTVEIEVLQPLAFLPAAGERAPSWEYRFPTVVGVRYQGAPGRVPDAARLDVDRADGKGTPVRVELDLRIADGLPGEILPDSPSHGIESDAAEGGAEVRLAAKSRLDRDLIVRWKAAGPGVGVALREGLGIGDDGGRYALLTLTPPEAPAASFARDLTLLIDASGSMHGPSIESAKLVAAQLLRSLGPEDRFEILAFSNNVEKLTREPLHATPANLEGALQTLHGLRAGGATEMIPAMVQALETLRPDSQRQVILLTDGFIGFESEVIGQVMKRLTPGARVHTVGIGSAPNRSLTHGLAQAGRGVEILVDDGPDAQEEAARLCRATERPVLTELEVRGTALKAVAPARPRDVMAGQPLLLGVELQTAGGVLEVCGRLAGQADPWVRRIEVAAAGGGVAGAEEAAGRVAGVLPLGALFGRWAVEDCELRLAAARDEAARSEVKRDIETLGMRHGITTRQTSLVAVAEDPTVDPKDPRRKVRLPVELPAGLSAEGVGLTPGFPGSDLRFSVSHSLLSELQSAGSITLGISDESELLEIMGAAQAGLPKESLEDLTRDADVLGLEGGVLVIEFPVPVDGFCFPEDSEPVEVRFPDGHAEEAIVIREDSSPRGPHDEGLIVRMALRLQGGGTWHHSHVTLRWSWKRSGFFRRRRGNLTLVVRIDERFLRSGDCE